MSRYSESVEVRLWRRVERGPVDACWEWRGATNSHGYGTIRERCVSKGAHVIAYRSTKGDVPAGLVVCHSCDNRKCCNPGHLLVGTTADNNADRNRKGRQARGERIRHAKLKAADVRVARFLMDCGVQGKRLARLFGTPQSNMSAIFRRKTWAHVPDLVAPGGDA